MATQQKPSDKSMGASGDAAQSNEAESAENRDDMKEEDPPWLVAPENLDLPKDEEEIEETDFNPSSHRYEAGKFEDEVPLDLTEFSKSIKVKPAAKQPQGSKNSRGIGCYFEGDKAIWVLPQKIEAAEGHWRVIQMISYQLINELGMSIAIRYMKDKVYDSIYVREGNVDTSHLTSISEMFADLPNLNGKLPHKYRIERDLTKLGRIWFQGQYIRASARFYNCVSELEQNNTLFGNYPNRDGETYVEKTVNPVTNKKETVTHQLDSAEDRLIERAIPRSIRSDVKQTIVDDERALYKTYSYILTKLMQYNAVKPMVMISHQKSTVGLFQFLRGPDAIMTKQRAKYSFSTAKLDKRGNPIPNEYVKETRYRNLKKPKKSPLFAEGEWLLLRKCFSYLWPEQIEKQEAYANRCGAITPDRIVSTYKKIAKDRNLVKKVMAKLVNSRLEAVNLVRQSKAVPQNALVKQGLESSEIPTSLSSAQDRTTFLNNIREVYINEIEAMPKLVQMNLLEAIGSKKYLKDRKKAEEKPERKDMVKVVDEILRRFINPWIANTEQELQTELAKIKASLENSDKVHNHYKLYEKGALLLRFSWTTKHKFKKLHGDYNHDWANKYLTVVRLLEKTTKLLTEVYAISGQYKYTPKERTRVLGYDIEIISLLVSQMLSTGINRESYRQYDEVISELGAATMRRRFRPNRLHNAIHKRVFFRLNRKIYMLLEGCVSYRRNSDMVENAYKNSK